jgi:class 3 adenylate cyclase/CHASE2 domain-containing sensor protein
LDLVKPFKRIPALVAFGVIVLVCLVHWLDFDFFARLERMTYDMRTREALRFSPQVATNLGFVVIDEESVQRVRNRSLGYSFGLYWPRQVYGRLLSELTEQAAKAISFDILFGELRPDHPGVRMANNTLVESDDFFANQMQRAGNVILAITPEVTPPSLFLTNALAAGDILAEKDSDGILRRACAFRVYRKWHPAFQQLADDPDYGINLHEAKVTSGEITLVRHGMEDIKVPLDADGYFTVADFWGENLAPGVARRAKPFTEKRVWHMGIVLAAQQLGLDLNHAKIELSRGRITLPGPGSLQRVIPVDARGYFYIDWSLPVSDPRLTKEAIQTFLAQNQQRIKGQTNELVNRWRDRLVVVGSGAVVGNNLTDRGATPLQADTLLVSKHWNVANSVLTGRFVRRTGFGIDLMLIICLGLVAAVLTWKLRALVASGWVLLVLIAYALLAIGIYIQTRYWIPIVMPVAGGLLMTHACLTTWRVVIEQAERRRVKSVFATIVSPKIVNELLKAKSLALGGARREVSVLFADVRGFTQFTDSSQERVAEFVSRNQLTGAAAEAYFDEQARETLDTINLYLGRVADIILQQDGLLDKFIGDCVMAFWGAPSPNSQHAIGCVRAAIEAQRAIYELNLQRQVENQQRAKENALRMSSGLPPKPLLPILFLGIGINSGIATVGLMGSAFKNVVRQGNYTVFGREVNLASRLESVSGHGRILIGQTTFELLRRDAPDLASTCLLLPAQKLKGISAAVTAYEVPWRSAGAPPLEQEFARGQFGQITPTSHPFFNGPQAA